MSVRKVKENKRRRRKVAVDFARTRTYRPGTRHASRYPDIGDPPHWDHGDEHHHDEDEVFSSFHHYGWGED